MAQLLFDVDQHIVEPQDFWTSRATGKYKDLVPQVVDSPAGGEAWSFDGGAWIRPCGLESAAGRAPTDVHFKNTYASMQPGCYDPKKRLDAMDIDGVEKGLMFPSVALSASTVDENDLYLEVFRIYNDALIDWCRQGDISRLIPVCLMPAIGVETAMEEVQRCADMGYRTIMFNSWPSGDPYPTEADEPFWSLLEELDMIISMHGPGMGRIAGASGAMPGEKKTTRVIRPAHQEDINNNRASGLSCARPVGQFVMTGIFDRHPKLKISVVETGFGWLPFFEEQLDRAYTLQRWAGGHELSMMPSEFLRRQLRGTIQLDGVAIQYRHAIGVERIMFSSDYPHATCDWPNSRQWMHHLTKGCTDEEREKILAGNALEWYGLN